MPSGSGVARMPRGLIFVRLRYREPQDATTKLLEGRQELVNSHAKFADEQIFSLEVNPRKP